MKSPSLFFYDLGLSLYTFTVRFISPFHRGAKQWTEGREGIWDRLKQLPPSENRVWFHCSSLGEYEQALPLIEKLKPANEILVTFFSPSGYEVVKRKNPDAHIFYLPPDDENNATRFVYNVQPKMAVFVRYDLWYHYLNQLKEFKIKTILISAVFREQDRFFKWYGGLFNEMLQTFAHIFVQDEQSELVLQQHGFKNVTKAGDTRVDRVLTLLEQGSNFPIIEQFKGNQKLFIVGSMELYDEEVALPAINKVDYLNLKFIIAPHHVDKGTVERIRKQIQHTCVLYSEATADNVTGAQVLIIDGVGILSRLYAYADIAYIGGGFGEGLHNILEPAVWGVPMIFGPKYHRFVEAVELVKRKGAFTINLSEDLTIFMASAWHGTLRDEAGEIVQSYIQERRGATEIIYNWLQDVSQK